MARPRELGGGDSGPAVRDRAARVEVAPVVVVAERRRTADRATEAVPAASLGVEKEDHGAVGVSEADVHGRGVDRQPDERWFGEILFDLVEHAIEIVGCDRSPAFAASDVDGHAMPITSATRCDSVRRAG